MRSARASWCLVFLLGLWLQAPDAAAAGCTTHAECDDGLYCNGTETCDPVMGCLAGAGPCPSKLCDEAADACFDCAPGGALWVTAGCSDGNACTVDACDGTLGCRNTPLVCDDGNACTVDGCNVATGCTFTPLSCDDGDACTNDSCSSTAGCAHTAVSCNDGNTCTTDSCLPTTGCRHAVVSCNDGVFCTSDSCDPAFGCRNEPDHAACDDSIDCTRDVCDPHAEWFCAHVAENASCDDGIGCNGAETCHLIAGCQPGTPSCDDGDSCTLDVCDAATDTCSHPPDNDRCDDGIDCTIDLCDTTSDGGCAHLADHARCDDSLPDTADACAVHAGCVHTHLSDDGSVCTQDVCDPSSGTCSHAPVSCTDEDVCTNDGCRQPGGCPSPAASACGDDGVFCNGVESCDGEKGCASLGPPCLPGWQCDEASRSCLSELWSSFWQVPAPDSSCFMAIVPTTSDPSLEDTEWTVEARCGDTVAGYGRLTELTILQSRELGTCNYISHRHRLHHRHIHRCHRGHHRRRSAFRHPSSINACVEHEIPNQSGRPSVDSETTSVSKLARGRGDSD
ncbi:MAG: hypothetical protein ACREAA_20530 [Candidatus Polarisedimenticolia bacterium]